MPKISIIIPVYNVAPYLRECLDSIQEQTFKDFEAILIDDGSTDGSGKICDWYASKYKRFKVIHKSNGGVSSARNMGLDIAQGEYIGFIDPDDFISHNFYEMLFDSIERNSADISISGFKLVDQHGKLVQFPEFFQTTIKGKLEGTEIMRAYARGEIIMAGLVDKLYKKSCFDNVRMPEGISLLEDGAIMPLVLSHAKTLVEEPRAIYYYRRRPNSLTSSSVDIKRMAELIKATNMMTDRIIKNCPEASKDASKLNLFYKTAGIIMLFSSIKRE
ncbi:MAG: hypothetical protein HPY66_3200 [Firmicutes bacterium]|nr:hypothetical protein [Bacillota bacterium]